MFLDLERKMHFGSDSQSGASARILDALALANGDCSGGYGDDEWTLRAVALLKEVFQCDDLHAFFVTTGTAANGLALSCMLQPWEAALCHGQAHVMQHESTGPELFSGGARFIGLDGEGKLDAERLDRYMSAQQPLFPHSAAVRVLSLAQAAENGLVYTPPEMAALSETARRHGLMVHMDGARFSNAVAALGCAPAEISWRAGVDVLCLGATKNGALAAEAVIFFKRGLAEPFAPRRKRAGHLLSKSQFLGAQFVGWLHDGHWLELARHANSQATRLAEHLAAVPGARLVWPTQANEVFAVLPRQLADGLQAAGAEFHEWFVNTLPRTERLRADEVFVRLVTSHATAPNEVERFAALARELASRQLSA